MFKERKMALTKEQEEIYKRAMEDAKRQLKNVDDQIERELQKVKEKLAELQESKKSIKMIYEGAAKLLGLEVDIEEEEEGSDVRSSMSKM